MHTYGRVSLPGIHSVLIAGCAMGTPCRYELIHGSGRNDKNYLCRAVLHDKKRVREKASRPGLRRHDKE